MTDTERLNWLEAAIIQAANNGERACVVLGAWYSVPSRVWPDGFSVSVGELIVDAAEHTDLRTAIDDAMEREPISP